MPTPPAPRFTNLADFESYLGVAGNSNDAQFVLSSVLCSAERMVERYCRRRFATEPALSATYTRQVIEVSGSAVAGGVPGVTGLVRFQMNSVWTPGLVLPLSAADLQTALLAIAGAGNLVCTGGPLPTWPISVTFTGTLTGEQPLIVADSSGLGSGFASVVDMGFDSLPPIMRRYTTRGKTTVRINDLRLIDAAPDPRIAGSGGIVFYNRRLLPNQYYIGADAYAGAGADESIGSGDYAEPATEIILGYGYGSGYPLAQQFAYVLPLGAMSNDLSITGRWGWNPVPVDIVDAVYSVASRRYRERDAAFSDQMITPEGIVFQFFKQLPASTQAALATYRVPNIALI